jgi:hypothetical protein
MQLHLSIVYVLQHDLSLGEIAQLFESEQSDSNSSSIFSTGASAIRTMPTAREKQLAEEWLKSEIPELSGPTVWRGVKLLGSGYRLYLPKLCARRSKRFYTLLKYHANVKQSFWTCRFVGICRTRQFSRVYCN